jgi:hypothetical protein
MVDLPLAVNNVLILICTRSESQTDTKEHFPIFANLSRQFFEGLPLFPATGDEHFFGDLFGGGLPDEVCLLSGARPIVIIAAVGASPRHTKQL